MLIRRGSPFNAITENKMIFSICRNFSDYIWSPVKFENCLPPPVVFKTPEYHLNGRDVPAFGITVSESNPENQVVVTHEWKFSRPGITICSLDGSLVSAYRTLSTSSIPNLKSGFRRLLSDRLVFAADGRGENSGPVPDGLIGEDGRVRIQSIDKFLDSECDRLDLTLAVGGYL